MDLTGKGKQDAKPKKVKAAKEKKAPGPKKVGKVRPAETLETAAPVKKRGLGPKKEKPKKAKGRVSDEPMEIDDEIVRPGETAWDDLEAPATKADPKVYRISAFEGGFVAPVLKDAKNISWHRAAETDLLCLAMRETLVRKGVFIGDIVIKASFVKRSQGGLLL